VVCATLSWLELLFGLDFAATVSALISLIWFGHLLLLWSFPMHHVVSTSEGSYHWALVSISKTLTLATQVDWHFMTSVAVAVQAEATVAHIDRHFMMSMAVAVRAEATATHIDRHFMTSFTGPSGDAGQPVRWRFTGIPRWNRVRFLVPWLLLIILHYPAIDVVPPHTCHPMNP